MSVQAKVRCIWNERPNWATDENDHHIVRFTPVFDADPASPNHSWSKATPAGYLELGISNELAFNKFNVNSEYLLTFEEVA